MGFAVVCKTDIIKTGFACHADQVDKLVIKTGIRLAGQVDQMRTTEGCPWFLGTSSTFFDRRAVNLITFVGELSLLPYSYLTLKLDCLNNTNL